jgi:polysaccharide export outer membrane protein
MFRAMPRNRRSLEVFPLLALAASLALGCAHRASAYDYGKEPDPRKQEFVLGPSDVLHINVWKNQDLSGDAVVRPDGTITVPLVGDVRAAGRTPGEVRTELTQRLGTFIKDDSAVVTVAVTAINSYRFTVSGNVERPGTYNSSHYVTVSEAMALAGGPNRYAAPEDTVVIRTDGPLGARRIPVDIPAMLAGKRPEQNLALLPGDVVYVP